MTADEVIAELIVREGGFTNRTSDPGGMTIWGLTEYDIAAILGHAPTEAEVRAITVEQAAAFYRTKYLEPFVWISDEALRVLVFDTAVLEGIGWAKRVLQTAVGVVPDGDLGPITRAAVLAADPRPVMKEIVRRRHRRELNTALSDVPQSVIESTRLEDLVGWWERVWAVGVKPL